MSRFCSPIEKIDELGPDVRQEPPPAVGRRQKNYVFSNTCAVIGHSLIAPSRRTSIRIWLSAIFQGAGEDHQVAFIRHRPSITSNDFQLDATQWLAEGKPQICQRTAPKEGIKLVTSGRIRNFDLGDPSAEASNSAPSTEIFGNHLLPGLYKRTSTGLVTPGLSLNSRHQPPNSSFSRRADPK